MNTNKHQRWRLLVGVAVLLGTSVVLPPRSVRSAGTEESEPDFTTHSLRGAYGFVASGFVSGATTPAVRAGLFTFDGAGGCAVVSVANAGTAGSAEKNSTTCSYTVQADGTGTLTADIPLHVFFVITHHGRELQLIRTETGVIASGVAKKQ